VREGEREREKREREKTYTGASVVAHISASVSACEPKPEWLAHASRIASFIASESVGSARFASSSVVVAVLLLRFYK
jgi:hypothetical protein